jgi:hypothetical protein
MSRDKNRFFLFLDAHIVWTNGHWRSARNRRAMNRIALDALVRFNSSRKWRNEVLVNKPIKMSFLLLGGFGLITWTYRHSAAGWRPRYRASWNSLSRLRLNLAAARECVSMQAR